MTKYIIFLVIIATSCTGQLEEHIKLEKPEYETIETDEFKLIKAKNQNGLLILFTCFPCDA